MVFNWTAEADRAILLIAIRESGFSCSQTFLETAAAELGGGVTPKAVRYVIALLQAQQRTDGTLCRHRWGKMKKDAKEAGLGSAPDA